MAKILNLVERMGVQFCVSNGLPVPRYIRCFKPKLIKIEDTNGCEQHIRVSLLGEWEKNGGEFKLLVEYIDIQFDAVKWIDRQRSVKTISFSVKGPYVWNNNQTRDGINYNKGAEWVSMALPLSPRFWAGYINNCSHTVEQLHQKNDNVVCATCGVLVK